MSAQGAAPLVLPRVHGKNINKGSANCAAAATRAQAECLGLPLYDAAMAALDAAIAEAQSTLASEDVTLEQCVAIVRVFEDAGRSFASIRMRAEKHARKLLRGRSLELPT
jgi:uncharacterized membrane protein